MPWHQLPALINVLLLEGCYPADFQGRILLSKKPYHVPVLYKFVLFFSFPLPQLLAA